MSSLMIINLVNKAKTFSEDIYDRDKGFTSEFEDKSIGFLKQLLDNFSIQNKVETIDLYSDILKITIRHSYIVCRSDNREMYIDITIDKLIKSEGNIVFGLVKPWYIAV